MADSSENTVQNSMVSNFINHVFDIGDESKKDLMNVIQFSVLAIIPLVALNKNSCDYSRSKWNEGNFRITARSFRTNYDDVSWTHFNSENYNVYSNIQW